MKTQHQLLIRPSEKNKSLPKRMAINLLFMLTTTGLAWAQESAEVDPVERVMEFIDKTAEATDLFNTNRFKEALAIFQELATNDADLDEDGFIAVAYADCLAALERDHEAFEAYEAATEAHPELATQVSQKTIELELAGEVSDSLIEELRRGAYSTEDEQKDRFLPAIRLGRALQKRAKTLLDEAAVVFRDAADWGANTIAANISSTLNHASMLEELAEDLKSLIGRTEAMWGSARQPSFMRQCHQMQEAEPQIVSEKQRSEIAIRTKDDRRIELQIRLNEPDCGLSVTANGRPIDLNDTQKLLIKRHQDRINTILAEAIDQMEQQNR